MVWQKTYASGYVHCSECNIWIKPDDIAAETRVADGQGRRRLRLGPVTHKVLLHKECGGRIRYHSRHKPHLFQRLKAKDPTYSYILDGSSKSEIRDDIKKWERLISPDNNNSAV